MIPLSFSRSGSILIAVATFVFMSAFAFQVLADSDTQRPNIVFSGPSSSTISGTITVTVNASDVSGIDRMAVNFHDADRVFIKACGSLRNLAAPLDKTYSCTFDTTKLPNGVYEIRAGAFDEANNNRTIAEWVTIDNSAE